MQPVWAPCRVRAFLPRPCSYAATPSPRTPLPRRHPQGHAPCLRLWRRCRVCRAAALQPAGAQQRVRPRQPEDRYRRGPCPGQVLLRGGQHRAAQRQAEDLPQGPGAGGGHGAGCADHVRSRADHAGARALSEDAGAPVGAGQRGELGQRGVLAPPGADAGDPVPRAGPGGDRGNPPPGAGHGAGGVRPRRPVHGLFRALPAVRLPQPPRSQPGHLHQRLPLEVPGPRGPRGRAGCHRPDLPTDPRRGRANPAPVPAGRRDPPRRAHGGLRGRARHLYHELQGPARDPARRAPSGHGRAFAEDRGPHQEPLLRGAHRPGVSPRHRRRRGRPAIRPAPDGGP